MTECLEMDNQLRDLIEIIHFTENVSVKIHGLYDEAEIYETVKKEFAESKRYTVTVFLLTDDGSKLRIATTSQPTGKLKAAEKASGLKMKEYKIDLEKSSILSKVVREGETVQVNFSDLVGDFLPRPLAYLAIKIIGPKEKTILTPLYRRGKIIGVFAMTSTEPAEHFIPSVRNLAQHISTALELADEQAERKQAEEALRKSEEKFRNIFEGVNDEILYVDKYGKIVDVNKRVEDIFGYKRDEVIGKNFVRLGVLQPKDLAKTLKQFMDAMRGGVVYPLMEYEIKDKKGNKVPVEASTRLIKKDGKIEGLLVIIRDVTERKRMEEEIQRYSEHLEELVEGKTRELRMSEERFRNIFEESPIGIGLYDSDGRLLTANKACLKIFGVSDVAEVKGFKLFQDPNVTSGIKVRLRRGETIRYETPFDFEKVKEQELYRTAKSGNVYLDVQMTPLGFEEKGPLNSYLIQVQDITERKRMEEELMKAERMATVGETAAMVGHDLRNPLQVIVNTLYLTKRKLKTLPPDLSEKHNLGELMETIREQVAYMDKIVSDLQDYARPFNPDLVPTSIRQLINDVTSRVTIPEKVEVSMAIPDDFPKLKVDPALMRRVFTNLVTNAVQAMPDGGKLTIRGRRTDEGAHISVEDTGVGIPEQYLDKLFKPLFTTKARGQGFGLSVCKRLVEAHNGRIMVESQVGKGSTFTVEIPNRPNAR